MHARMTIVSVLFFCFSSAFGMHSSRSFIHADDVHSLGITGLGVTVAVIDVGIDYSHPGLVGSNINPAQLFTPTLMGVTSCVTELA